MYTSDSRQESEVSFVGGWVISFSPYMDQLIAAPYIGVRQRVVPEPSVHITGDSAYALLHRDAPVAARQVPQLLLEPMDALRR